MKRKRYWVCRGCGTRNERIKQKCSGDGCKRSRPKARVAPHAATLRDDSYADYCAINETIHGVTDESCAICRRPRGQSARHHRDHGHAEGTITYGKPRGLLCFRCNNALVYWMTPEWLSAASEYTARVDAYYRKEGTNV